MGTWIEIRCENRSNAEATAFWNGTRYEKCFSHDNSGPMGEASDTREGITKMLAGLAKDARAAGWRRTRGGWICPHCMTFKRPNSEVTGAPPHGA